ncbi:hypothetical protein [Mycolicibacterium fortuitum]|uniref:hypothetical protein n=1 Tax=Mycolicibacterium fortuitum TaxID=1766 RepID=UPI003AAB1815
MTITATAPLTELDVMRKSGLPGPLIRDLLPRLESDMAYHTSAPVYGAESVDRACIARDMIAAGIRYDLVRFCAKEPISVDELADVRARWAQVRKKFPQQPGPPQLTATMRERLNPRLSLAVSAAALLIIELGTSIGYVIGG